MTTSKRKTTFAMLVLLLLAVAMLLPAFAKPVWAAEEGGAGVPDKLAALAADASDEDSEGTKVHKDPLVFQKNFDLTPEQKEYTITEIDKVVDRILDPEMSDLEKYYRLAIWANKRVTYDWNLWMGHYDFDFYSHQWDSYGCMKEGEKSVCVGIAVFYSDLCHAAGLPCRIVRSDPDKLDHTINYLPDINGNAYYVDVTENMFLMSDVSNPYVIDKAFSNITKDATEATFSYKDKDAPAEAMWDVTGIKNWYYKPFEEWFKEYALHEDPEKVFGAEYVEKGSGLRSTEAGYHHASYQDDLTNYGDTPGVWFLDDFYNQPGKVPAGEIESKIRNKEFDERFLIVSGLKGNYNCDMGSGIDKLKEAVQKNIAVSYFPSSQNGQIVAAAADLKQGVDYQVAYAGYDEQTNTAEFTITGMGAYSGKQKVQVKVNSNVVMQAPVYPQELVYDGTAKELLKEAGEAKYGKMQYALGTKTEAKGSFSAEIPKAVDAGKYYVWYQAAGDAAHTDTQPQRMTTAVAIAKAANPITVKAKTKSVTIKYKKLKKKAQTLKASKLLKVSKPEGKVVYYLASATKGEKSFEKKFRVNEKTGNVTVKKGLKKGTYRVELRVGVDGNDNYEESYVNTITVQVKVR